MTKKKKETEEVKSFRAELFDYCIDCLPESKRYIKISSYSNNDVVELKRFEAFFRLYISETGLRASIRMNTINCSWRIDDAPLFEPPAEEIKKYEAKGANRENIECEFPELKDLGVPETLRALNEIPYAMEENSHGQYWVRDAWLYDWIPSVMMQPDQRTAVQLEQVSRDLRNIAYYAEVDALGLSDDIRQLADHTKFLSEIYEHLCHLSEEELRELDELSLKDEAENDVSSEVTTDKIEIESDE